MVRIYVFVTRFIHPHSSYYWPLLPVRTKLIFLRIAVFPMERNIVLCCDFQRVHVFMALLPEGGMLRFYLKPTRLPQP